MPKENNGKTVEGVDILFVYGVVLRCVFIFFLQGGYGAESYYLCSYIDLDSDFETR